MKNYRFYLMSLATVGLMASCSNDDDVVDNTDDDMPGEMDRAELYVTSGSSGNVTVYNMGDTPSTTTLNTNSSSNEGVFYDSSNDELLVASRSDNRINSFMGISDMLMEQTADLELNISSESDLESPRKIAVNGNTVVVADNADVDGDDTTDDGRFFIYTRSEDGLMLRNTVIVDFAVWGITFNGNSLYAVVDKTSDLAIFDNFSGTFTADEEIMPTKRITIEGIVRTHGIAYDSDDDVLVMTDIGSADSDSDGAFHFIEDANSKIAAVEDGGMLSVSEQVRVEGDNTFLGNPVDVVYDEESENIYIAEVANGGGRVLAFDDDDYEAGGNISPIVNNELAGANSLFFHEED
ncbi:hypothetical protein [Salegentibacter sp. Hel_I_6]|uniref:hypothetical protein n=1 Tax=Salegentibacter sp. Hel_I_6 TaxID=1250278 RepID=UPI00055FE448|nr:hypothetical protein [Salegentibacter sp. Hel_I_6]